LTIRHETRSEDDGYRTPLAPGLRSTHDARRLAEELAFSNGRLIALAIDPPGLYDVIATEPDLEEACWLALLTAYLGVLDGPRDPFAGVAAVRTSWHEQQLPDLAAAELGPRTAHDPARGSQTLIAYRRFAEQAGSQAAALSGDDSWGEERRFERAYERLALPGLHRRARYELLVSLGSLGRVPARAPGLLLSEDDPVSIAAKRVFGIGDPLLLDRRARKLAEAVEIPIAALDLALESWARSEPLRFALDARDADTLTRAVAALDCEASD
jgi:hypothetical protein